MPLLPKGHLMKVHNSFFHKNLGINLIKPSTYYYLLLLFFFSFSPFLESKPPSLTPRDTKVKIEEILKAHVSYQKLSPEIIKRAFQNFLEELDPSKTYLLASEIETWMQPDDTLLLHTLEGIKKEDYTVFSQIHEIMAAAISRRNELEIALETVELPKTVDLRELKDLKWASSIEDLSDRLLKIRAAQLEAAQKVTEDKAQQFLLRMNKRRLTRQEDLVPKDKGEKVQLILSYVLKSVSSALDSQTAYFTPAEANQFMIQVQQRLFGIGAQLRDELNGLSIVRLLDGGPASMGNKLRVGDKIIAVDQQPIIGFDIVEAVELIRGQQGTPVNLTILRQTGTEAHPQEDKLEVEIIRGEVVLKETRYDTHPEHFGDGIIAYLHLYSFYQDPTSSSTQDLAASLATLKQQYKVKAVVLDLRNNAGGLLPQAVSVAGLFMGKGVVVSVKDNTGMIQHLRNLEDEIAWDGPLVVLVNRTSASAAEIVAQTLQDYGRAIVVGDASTYGKGTFQTFTLEASHFGKVNPKGEFKVTRGRYYTVSGKSPQLVGVQSDILVPGPFSEMEIGEKFSKYPLENESISPNFDDDLSDVPPFQRFHLARIYKSNLQPILHTYDPFLELLKRNSQERIKQNPVYQKLITEMSKKDLSYDWMENLGQVDLQLQETMNVVKDLLFFMQENREISQKAG